MKLLQLPFSIILILSVISACTATPGAASFESELRDAERAVARGDMQAAVSVAAHLSDDPQLHTRSAEQLGRLSMVYIQLADSIDHEANVDKAADIYDIALSNDPDSTRLFFQSVDPAQMQYAETIAARSAMRKNPLDMSRLDADESSMDSISSFITDSI